MEKKITDTVKNIMTIGGAIAMACVLLDEVSDNGELKKIAIGEPEKELKQLTDGTYYDKPDDKRERDAESKKKDDEITELKKKLAELENKSGEQSEQ